MREKLIRMFEGRDDLENQQAKETLDRYGLYYDHFLKDQCTTDSGRVALITPAGGYDGLEGVESFCRISHAILARHSEYKQPRQP